MQIAIVYVGGRPLRTVPLTAYENLYAIGLASFVLPWCVFCKMCIPAAWFDTVELNEKAMSYEDRMRSHMSASQRISYNKKEGKGQTPRGSTPRNNKK